MTDDEFEQALLEAMISPIKDGTKCECGNDPCGMLHFWVKIPEKMRAAKGET